MRRLVLSLVICCAAASTSGAQQLSPLHFPPEPRLFDAPLAQSASSGAPTPSAARAPRWVGEDKWMHFFASFFATTVAGAGARAAGVAPEQSLRVGVATGAAVGLAKEFHDLRRGARWGDSLLDLGWDAAGVGAGAALLRRTF
jgi:uncharacterized protein YfiM (DUF2279 family)